MNEHFENNNPYIPDTNDKKNWTEDYHLENGQYMNTCCHCGCTFIGYKRRVVCKECAND